MRIRRWTESGLRYCVTHQGVVDVDTDGPCDFARDDQILPDEQPDCVLRPLCFRR